MELDVKKEDLKKVIGKGSEGIVYYYKGVAIKIFNKITENKILKIRELINFNNNNLILPIDLCRVDGEIKGYYMKYINNYINMYEYINQKKTLKEKIETLQNIENIFKKVHQEDILIIDMNPRNFLNKDGKWYFIDCDNYFVNNLKNDINPLYFYRYYKSKITENININFDKFQFFMYAIDYITLEHMDDKRILFYRDGFNYLENYINNLIIPIEIKNIFLEQVSKTPEKIYIGEHLEYLKTNNREFIKSRK